MVYHGLSRPGKTVALCARLITKPLVLFHLMPCTGCRRTDVQNQEHTLPKIYINTIAYLVNNDGLQPTSNGLQPTSDGLQPTGDGLQPLLAMASNLQAMASKPIINN